MISFYGLFCIIQRYHFGAEESDKEIDKESVRGSKRMELVVRKLENIRAKHWVKNEMQRQEKNNIAGKKRYRKESFMDEIKRHNAHE